MIQRAFTVIELIVVVGIIAVLSAIGLGGFQTGSPDAQVRTAAEDLASWLRRARALAISERVEYGIAFNLQNAVGSSGQVLNNRDGGHWYRMIGPARSPTGSAGRSGRLPVAGNLLIDTVRCNPQFPDFTASIAESWRGQPLVLPPGKVRFLALGDTDEGPRVAKGRPFDTGTVWYGNAGETTWPRPWFGWWDQTSGRLWAWGGYDAGKPSSGFFYQGSGPAVTGCIQPDSRTYNNDFNDDKAFADTDLNSDGDVDDPREREVNVPLWRQGEPRPLTDAAWLDACIIFRADGSARYLEWNRGRRAYLATSELSATSPLYGRNGVNDRCKTIDPASTTCYTGPDSEAEYDKPEVGHFLRHNGGWHITLARDARSDTAVFPSAKDALDSILPAWRVFVGANGIVDLIYVQRRQDWPVSLPVWPANPGDWLDTGSTGTNAVWRNCRLGWLHTADTGNNTAAKLVPRGRPINNILSERMLRDRIWWIDQ
jgi:prepilin-type N-terminal cleavage/methylation domain-containing protein